MKLSIDLPYDEPIDTPSKGKRGRGKSRETERPLTQDDRARVYAPPGAPRRLDQIPEAFRKPLAPPGRR